MAGVNRVFLLGNLGADPEVKTTPAGSTLANLRLATNESWTDKVTGEPIDRTEWHDVVLFGRLAEVASQYLRKGSGVYIDGKVQTRKWEDQSGQTRYSTEILGRRLEMIDSSGGEVAEKEMHAQSDSIKNDSYSNYPDDGKMPF